ncbi:hypothetical protein BVIET440_30077 [Burkholderia vietnamiensis]
MRRSTVRETGTSERVENSRRRGLRCTRPGPAPSRAHIVRRAPHSGAEANDACAHGSAAQLRTFRYRNERVMRSNGADGRTGAPQTGSVRPRMPLRAHPTQCPRAARRCQN